MVIQISYSSHGQQVELDLAYEDEPFTIGRSEDCTVCLSQFGTELSRWALVIEEPAEHRLRIRGGQRYGYVQVTRDDGVHKATLGLNEEFQCGAGTYQVLLRATSQEVFSVDVTVGKKQRLIEPGALTIGMWTHQQIFDPTPEADWRWLAVMPRHVVRSGTASP